MKLIHTVAELRKEIASLKQGMKSLGFVPTMGALHEGHASLIKAARVKNDFVLVSIFVNPSQFGKNEDLSKYPRTLDDDCCLAVQAGVDFVFAPDPEEIYPPGYETYVEVGRVAEPLCGKFRPGHFRGVATVVNRLFHLVEPTRAYFGQKDIQQCLVLKRMVKDFGTPVELVICPTIREMDGLAMSSRNRFLTSAEREKSLVIYRALQAAKALRDRSEWSVEKILRAAFDELKKAPEFQLQYLELLSYPDLEKVGEANIPCVIAIAGFLGNTRLIDNEVFYT